MDLHERFRKNVRGFYAWLGSVLVAAVAPFVAVRLTETWTLTGRIAGVVVGTLAWVPLILVIGAIIRAGDEFIRRIHLVAIAIAFGAGLFLITFLGWLAQAHFIEQPPIVVAWLVFGILWVVCLYAVKRHYERQP